MSYMRATHNDSKVERQGSHTGKNVFASSPSFSLRKYIVLSCTVLYFTVLYFNVLYFTVLYCTVLYGTATIDVEREGHCYLFRVS